MLLLLQINKSENCENREGLKIGRARLSCSFPKLVQFNRRLDSKRIFSKVVLFFELTFNNRPPEYDLE